MVQFASICTSHADKFQVLSQFSSCSNLALHHRYIYNLVHLCLFTSQSCHSQHVLSDQRLHEPDFAFIRRFPFDLFVVIGVELQQADPVYRLLGPVPVATLVLQVDEVLKDVHVPDAVVVRVHTVVTASLRQTLKCCVVVHLLQKLAQHSSLYSTSNTNCLNFVLTEFN